jgi:glycine/D-amino acid oxidase-like deaminating enzyme
VIASFRPYRSSLEACGVLDQWLDAAEVMRRWPAFRLDADVCGLWQADGMVPAAHGTGLMRRLEADYGATLVSQAPVTAVRDLGGRVEVATADGRFRAGQVLLCTDAWTGDLLAQLDPDPAASERLAGFLRTRLPAAAGSHDHTATCLYTLTPDRDLVLAPLLGRVLADLALHGGTDVDITPFAPGRPALTAAEPEARYLV